MNVLVIKEARRELREAIRHYNQQRDELGKEFRAEFLQTVERIKQLPEGYVLIGDDVRRCRFRRFPYSVVYSAEEETIIILAVAHASRRPDYWLGRGLT